MVAVDYNPCYGRVRVHEGGNDNDPRDPGGRTSRGVIQREWNTFRTTHPGRPEDVWQAPEADIAAIYRQNYWDALRCDSLPVGVDDSIFDYGVNSGIGRAGKVLRRVIGLPDNDWHVTADVIAALGQRDPAAVINAINDERMRFLRSLGTFSTFGNGWTRRVAEVRAFSLQLAGGATPPPPRPDPTIQGAGKGKPVPPNTGSIVVGGGAAAGASGGLVHWLGAHPALSVAIFAAGIALVIFVLTKLHQAHQAAQDAPTPGLVPVPVTQGSSS